MEIVETCREAEKLKSHAHKSKGMERARLFREAIVLYSLVVREDPGFRNAVGERGQCYEEIGDLPAAEKDFITMLEHEPELVQPQIGAYIHLSRLMKVQGKYPESLDYLEKLIAVEESKVYYGKAANRYLEKSELLEELGRKEEARVAREIYDEYRKAEQAKWDDPDHRYHYY